MNEIPNNLWPGWETVRLIGRGSFGAVYEIQRTIRGRTEHAALKVLSIPQHESEVEELRADGYDDDSITQYFADSLDKIESEYAIMADMKGHSNVVYCDDIRTVQHDNGYGWDIYIKMELLTPLKSQLGNDCSEDTVVQLGKDICNALKLCEELHIVHRDIKPENIFVARDGNFKLGDFGIAKTMENTTGGTKTGTYDYMAPEVYNNQPYHTQADIYSLGLVLYWLLNERTAPFLEISAKPTPSTKNRARERRFSGETLPAPKNGSDALKAIVLKACAYKPEDRYQSAAEMLEALAALSADHTPNEKQISVSTSPPIDDTDETVGPGWKKQDEQEEQTVGPDWKKAEKKDEQPKQPEQPQKPKRKWLFPVIAGVLVIALLIAALSMGNLFEPKGKPLVKIISVRAGTTHTVALKSDGTVLAVGANDCGQCDVSLWTDIIDIEAGNGVTIGLKSDGTIVTAGNFAWGTNGQTQIVPDWTNITDIYLCSCGVLLGLTSARTVVTNSERYVEDVSAWSNIVEISEAYGYPIGLKTDGTISASVPDSLQEYIAEIQGWTDVVSVAGSYYIVAALKKNGTVSFSGINGFGDLDVSGWQDITSVYAGDYRLAGIKADGSVITSWSVEPSLMNQYDMSAWRNMASLSISSGYFAGSRYGFHVVGLQSDGTVVAVGDNQFGQCDVAEWNLLNSSCDHKWTDPTCTEGKICTACGAVGGAARGHNWTAATNTAPKTCTTCGAIEGEPLKTIAIIAKGESHAFWQAVKAGAIAAGKETGYNVTFCGPTNESEGEVPSQIEMVRDALDSHVHGIGLATIGLGFSDELIRAYNLGIPVAEFDSGLYSNNADVTSGKDPTIGSIATSNYRSSENAAENLYAYLKSQNVLCNGYKVGIIQHDFTQTGIDRANGFKNKIQSLAFSDGYILDIKVLEKQNNQGEYKLGLIQLADWGAQAIFMTNEVVVNEVYPEVRDSAAAYMDILFVGFDAGTKQYEWIKDAGTNYALLVGSVAQDSYMIGYQTVRMLVDKLSGRAVSDIDVVGRWYTAENVDELMAQNIFYMG